MTDEVAHSMLMKWMSEVQQVNPQVQHLALSLAIDLPSQQDGKQPSQSDTDDDECASSNPVSSFCSTSPLLSSFP